MTLVGSQSSAVRALAERVGAALLLLSLFCLCVLSGCQGERVTTRLAGVTMGTAWHVSIVDIDSAQRIELQEQIQQVLDAVNEAMSTYLPDSDLSRFNRAPVAECIKVTAHTWRVTKAAIDVARQTGGAFNPGVATLVELWGFGANTPQQGVPQQHEIDDARQKSQLSQLMLDQSQRALCKKGPITLDYSAIAKGYAVDEVAALLDRRGFEDYLVEVGGEVKTSGLNADRQHWRIGIEKPQLGRGVVLAAVSLSGDAVATSGDYRNYREVDGRRYSHTIDPVTGMPVMHQLASVTVVMPSAMEADAYATALNVMGPEKGLAFALQRALPVYMVVKSAEGFEARHSPAFARYLQSTP